MNKKYVVLAVLFVVVAVSFYAFAAKPRIVQEVGQKVIEAVAPTTYEPMFSPSPVVAAGTGSTEMYARIGDIMGGVDDKDHKGYVSVESFSWGVDKSGTSSPKSRALVLKIKTDKSSPKLFDATAKGTHQQRIDITLRRPGQMSDFMKWNIMDAVITSFSTSADLNNTSVDELSISVVGSIKAEYSEIKADGSKGASVSSGWDFKTGKAL